MASTSVVFDLIANDRASAKFAHLSKSIDDSGGALHKFSNLAGHAAKAAALAGVAAAGVAIKLGVDSVEAASDLNETLSKSRVIFGSHAKGMEAWAESADKAMGLSEQAALESAAGFGDMFSQIGFSGDQATKMSKNVVKLAADLGSFNNLDTADVLERLSGGFRGEYDSLQALIPNISAARVQTAALAATGKTNASELTAQEKAAATLAIVQKDGARAQGDFARTSGGLANQTKILKAELENASASIGTKLLPVVLDATTWIGDRLPGALDAVDSKAGPVFNALVDGAGDAVDAVKPAAKAIAEAFEHMTDSGSDVGNVWEGTLLPALETTSDVVAKVVNFIDDLPGPVKTFGAEAAVAAVGVSKLADGMAAIKASSFITSMRDSEKRASALGGAAKTAAGVGGLALLMDAMQDTSEESQSLQHILKVTAGGAGIGAMFGPIGALVGAVGGVGLAAAFSETKDEARRARIELMKTQGLEDARDDADKLATALYGVVDAYGRTSRAAVRSGFFGKDGLDPDVQALRDMGVSMDTIVSATMGQADAQKIVRDHLRASVSDAQSLYEKRRADYETLKAQVDEARKQGQQALGGRGGGSVRVDPELEHQLDDAKGAMDDAKDSLDELNVSQDVFHKRVHDNIGAIREHRQQMKGLADDLHIPLEAYKKWPKAVRTKIEADDLPDTSEGILRLIDHYKGLQSFKKIQALVSAPGVDLVPKQIKTLQDRYKLTPKEVATIVSLESGGATSDLNAYRTLLRNLDSPTNDVNNYIYTHHVSTGGGSGGGADVYDDAGGAPRRTMYSGGSTATLPAPTITPVHSRTVKHVHEHRTVKHVIEVRVVGGELDLTKAKHQIHAIAREVSSDEIDQDRAFAESQSD